MEIIKQTNRTILFDAVNPDKMDILNLMAGVEVSDKSLTDEKVKEIHSHLLVKSFDEFLKKFAPTIYSYFDAESKKMVYTLEKPMGIPSQLVKEIVIDRNNQFLKTFLQLIDGKRSSNKTNVSFDYETILNTLSPQKTLKDMKRLKKDINYLAEESLKLEEDSPSKLKKLKQLSRKINETEQFYSEFPSQIALMIGAVKENLTAISMAGEKTGSSVSPALPYFDGSGEMKTLTFTPDSDSILKLETKESTKLLMTELEEHYELLETQRTEMVTGGGNGDGDKPAVSSLMKELVVSAFTDQMSTALSLMETPQKVELYNNYSALYNSWQRDFIKVAKPVFERLLGVKAFFDQYSSKTKEMAPTLLVTNVSADEMAESMNMEKLHLYLETVNNKTNYTDTIWFGIIPRIELSSGGFDDDFSDDMTPDFAEKWGYTGEFDDEEISYFTPVATMQTILEGIKKYKIQTFFGFQTGEDTTFSKMATEGVEPYLSKVEEIEGASYDEFAIACFPNITIVPEDKSRVVTSVKAQFAEDGNVNFPKELQNDVKFWMKGVYIGAEYVAAGMAAAWQCPGYLKTYFKKVYPDFPGVRFDIEEDNQSLRLPSMFAKEISGYTNTIREEIETKKFGFVLSSDDYHIDGKEGRGITVMNARSMHMDRRTYRSLFQTTRRTYIERMMAAQLRSKDERSIRGYFEPSGQISVWQKFGNWVNSIIREGEKVELQNIEEGVCDIRIESKGISESFTIEITENE